jgi:predicted transposase YbfD/YdcC
MATSVSRKRRLSIASKVWPLRGESAAGWLESIRQHWGVENGLHWRLDVQMNEDQCRL